jgi:hypothetical protein
VGARSDCKVWLAALAHERELEPAGWLREGPR